MKTTLITTLALEDHGARKDYINKSIELVKGYLRDTDEVIFICTNRPDRFRDLLGTGRLIISYMDPTNKGFRALKRTAIRRAEKCCDKVIWRTV